jgi:NhaP-type Na+/H+ or K+/H+ antiporter
MVSLTLSLIFGFLLGTSAVWLVSRINDRYTQREESRSRLLLKRAKRY